jgi:hypothetical protein
MPAKEGGLSFLDSQVPLQDGDDLGVRVDGLVLPPPPCPRPRWSRQAGAVLVPPSGGAAEHPEPVAVKAGREAVAAHRKRGCTRRSRRRTLGQAKP